MLYDTYFKQTKSTENQMFVGSSLRIDCFVAKFSFFHLGHILSSIERTIGLSLKSFAKRNDWIYDIYKASIISWMEIIWLICNFLDYIVNVCFCVHSLGSWIIVTIEGNIKHQFDPDIWLYDDSRRMVKGVISFSRECWMI